MHLDVRCPQCGSLDQVGKVSTLHAASTTRTTVRVPQQSLTGEWHMARGTAITRTHLARRLAPPRLPARYMLPAVAAVVLAVMAVCSLGALADDPSRLTPSGLLGVIMVVLILAGLLVGAVVLTVIEWRKHQAKLPGFRLRLQQWQGLFYCTRCDKTFVPATRRVPAR
ncbi:hypothetical protein [Dactylosporangium sp. CA-139066]|uniref:hypothetical protein n=1 Tax=Dactylosporangium sp. CA-139066 TaxID=3239930 RepID=UPI003D8D6322